MSEGKSDSSRNKTCVLKYPAKMFQPEDLIHFIEHKKLFTETWKNLKLGDDDLEAFQVQLMAKPTQGAVITGTHGLRKIRYSPSSWGKGKSNSLRVCYVYFEEYATIYLILVYPKSSKDNIHLAQKKAINTQIDRIKMALSKGTYS